MDGNDIDEYMWGMMLLFVKKMVKKREKNKSNLERDMWQTLN